MAFSRTLIHFHSHTVESNTFILLNDIKNLWSLSLLHNTHTHTQFSSATWQFFAIILKVNTYHNLGTFAKKMSPTSLTIPCSMLSSSSKEIVLPSSCVTIMPKRVHKKKHVPDSDGRINMHNENEKKSHRKQSWWLTCQSTQCLQGNLDTQQLAQNVSNSNEMILIFKHCNPWNASKNSETEI